MVTDAGCYKCFLSPRPAERVKGAGRGSEPGRRRSGGGVGWSGGTRPSGNAAQRNLSEPRKKRKWQRKQGQIEPSSGISNELTQFGHSINTWFLMSVRVHAPRVPSCGCASPAVCSPEPERWLWTWLWSGRCTPIIT